MKWNYLFPNSFKKIGWLLFIPGLILGMFILFDAWQPEILQMKVFAIACHFPASETSNYWSFTQTNLIDEIAAILILFGGMLVAFAKEKEEDEFIAKIRMDSLVWSVYANYAVLLFATIFVYAASFFTVLVVNMFTILIFFIIRFNLALIKSRKHLKDEK